MMSASSELLMLGLRGSGKTTYLAALWHFLESAEVRDRLVVPHLQPDRDYLNAIRNSWLSFKPVGRTSMRANAVVTVVLEDKITKSQIEISLPDLSGESFRLQWATRKAPKTYVDYARNCTAVFLFVHPNEIRRTHAIKAKSETGEDIVVDEVSAKITPAGNWNAELTSTQVQLVEVLQLLAWMRNGPRRLKIAVVISAWDTVKAKITPVGWLERRLPLLSQYLQANSSWLESEVFGVSAQGGDLVFDKERLLSSSTASSRCLAVQGNSLDTVSLSAPLQFLLDGRKINGIE